MVNIIVAYTKKGRVIGAEGRIPWRIKEDVELFKSITEGHPVVMGRKTWESIPKRFRPLVNRHNIVVTRSPDEAYVDTPYISFPANVPDAIKLAQGLDDSIYIIGGEQIYKEALVLDIVDTVYASEIHQEYFGEAFFPHLPGCWFGSIVEEYEEFNFIRYDKVSGVRSL